MGEIIKDKMRKLLALSKDTKITIGFRPEEAYAREVALHALPLFGRNWKHTNSEGKIVYEPDPKYKILDECDEWGCWEMQPAEEKEKREQELKELESAARDMSKRDRN